MRIARVINSREDGRHYRWWTFRTLDGYHEWEEPLPISSTLNKELRKGMLIFAEPGWHGMYHHVGHPWRDTSRVSVKPID